MYWIIAELATGASFDFSDPYQDFPEDSDTILVTFVIGLPKANGLANCEHMFVGLQGVYVSELTT